MREAIGRNISRHRKRTGLSQEEAAMRASLHRTEIGLLERGERMPRADTVIRLAGALGVPPGDLLAGITWEPGFTQRGKFELPNEDESAET